MKLKKEYIILAVVMAALILYLAMHKSNRTHYKLPAINHITEKQISKIEITKNGKSVVLQKKDDNWYINAKEYPADRDKVTGMLRALKDFAITALVSESKNYIRYDLSEDKKITVTAWEGKKLLRRFQIGKEAPTFHHTFVLLPGDINVYHARGDFRRIFDRKLDDLRDMVVLAFEKDDIRQIDITTDKISLALNKKKIPVSKKNKKPSKASVKPQMKTVWQNGQGKNMDLAKVDTLLRFLNKLECEKYIYDTAKDKFKEPQYLIVLNGNKKYSLSIFNKIKKDGKNHPGVSSENNDPFILSDSQVDSIKTKIYDIIREKK